MKKYYSFFLLFFSVLFLNAQNNSESHLQLLSRASQIIFANSVAETDISTLREAAKIIPEIMPVADLLINKTYDKNIQKHIDSQTAIKNQIGKLTNKKGLAYAIALHNLASDYSNRADYEDAQQLYVEALSVLNAEPKSDSKTQWNYIVRFSQILNRDFGRSSVDFMQLEEIITEIVDYLNSYPQNEGDEIILLCLNTIMGANMLQIPFEQCEVFYLRGKDLAVKKSGTQQETVLAFQSIHAAFLVNENKLDYAENVINQTIKESEQLFGKDNLLKSYELYRLGSIQMNKGDVNTAISTLEQSVVILSKILGEGNINVLNIKRELANTLLYTGKSGVDRAGKLIDEIAEQSKQNNGEISEQYINALTSQIGYYQFIENITAYRSTLKKAHELATKLATKNKLDAGLLLNQLFAYYRDINSFDEAIAISDEAMAIFKDTPKSEVDYANSFFNKSQIYLLTENPNEAEKCLNEAIPILKNSGNQQYYADGLTFLGSVYSQQKRKEEAENTLSQAYQIYKKNSLEYSGDFGSLLVNYANILEQNDKSQQSKDKFEEAINFATETENDFLLGTCYENYSSLYYGQNDFQKAMDYLNKAETYFLKCGDNGIIQRGQVLVDKSYIYRDLGQYNEAKSVLTEVRNITERMKGKTSYDYFQSIMSLYNLAFQTGNGVDMQNYIFDMAKAFYEQQQLSNSDMNQMLNIANLVMPAMLNYFIEMQNQLGMRLKDFVANIPEKEKKEFVAKYGQSMFDNLINNSTNNINIILNNFGEWLLTFKSELDNRNRYSKPISQLLGDYYYSIMQDNDKALKYYREFIEGQDKNSLNYAAGLHRLSQVYFNNGDYNSAALYEKQCIDINKSFVSNKSIDLSYPLNHLSSCYYNAKDYSQAFLAAKERFEILQPNINSLFNTMNENDRLALSVKYGMNARDIYDLLSVYPQDEVTQMAYDAALYYKGLLLRSSNRIRQSIYASKNMDLINGYEQLMKMRKQLQSMPNMMSRFATQDTVGYLQTRQLHEKVDSLDWYLTQNSATYRKEAKTPKWTEIQSNLKDGEVAIEFIISTDTIDNCNCKYSALLLKKDAKAPMYIPLFKEQQLVDIVNDCGNDINKLYQAKEKQLYELIWQPIEAKLKNETTIYYSPVKKLYSIAFSALPLNEKQNYNFKMLSSTAELVNHPNLKSEINKADVYGEIKYGEGRHWGEFRTFEASMIDSLLHLSSSVVSKLHTGVNATEETFRKNNGNSATWIHLDTHGEYEKLKENENEKLFSNRFGNAQSNPMNRAMLPLANAHMAWDDENMKPYESDGVLLASEIAEMDLNKTDLLVLSACKTGLGEESETEGIFGLQRAFKQAGVKTMLMTLWSVNAEATTIFMAQFYSNLIKGINKNDAFQNAVSYLKNYQVEVDDESKEPLMQNGFEVYPKKKETKYNCPYYWAAYVMLD
jgi:CHAT domain-containing protein